MPIFVFLRRFFFALRTLVAQTDGYVDSQKETGKTHILERLQNKLTVSFK